MGGLEFDTLVTIAIYILTIASLYWKMRMDIAKISLEIAEIKCDRKERWGKHDEKQDKSDAYLSDILMGIEDLKGDIKVAVTDIAWLKNTKKK